MKTFLMFRDPGPAWVAGTPTRQQPLWEEHAAFMDRLDERGRIVLAGPYADSTGHALVIIEARDRDEAAALFDLPGSRFHTGVKSS